MVGGGNYPTGSKGRVQSKQADRRPMDKLKGDDEVEPDCRNVEGFIRCEVTLMGVNGRTVLSD